MNPLDDKEKEWLSSHTKFHLGLTVDEILEMKKHIIELVSISDKLIKEGEEGCSLSDLFVDLSAAVQDMKRLVEDA